MDQLPDDIDGYIAQRLRQVLPAEALAVLLTAAHSASDQGWEIYLVGGYVRDCLLKVPDYDIDLSVVGDGQELARKVAQRTGARLEIHDGFGTATLLVGAGQYDIDIVTARREWYERPGALPTVEAGTIVDDMARRDFTVNAMAVQVRTDGFGALLDPHGGLADLKAGVTRVLHAGSFRDDPTRIFRAVKLAVRLGFKIERSTQELILQAVRDDAVSSVSIERITRELLLIMEEPLGGEMLAQLDKLGVLTAMHPALGWPYPEGRMGPRPDELMPRSQRRDTYLAVLGAEFAAAPEEAEALARWLKLPAPQVRVMRDSAVLAGLWAQLGAEDLKQSETYRLLHPIDKGVLEAYTRIGPLAQDTVPWARLHDYLHKLSRVKPQIGGDYLKEIGVPQGAIYRQLLDALMDAKLDGQVRDLEDEKRFVGEWLARNDTHEA